MVWPVTRPRDADTADWPAAIACARPELLMVATEGADVAHETELVMATVLPSEYFPVATNCCALPAAREVFAGVIEIELRTAGVI